MIEISNIVCVKDVRKHLKFVFWKRWLDVINTFCVHIPNSQCLVNDTIQKFWFYIINFSVVISFQDVWFYMYNRKWRLQDVHSKMLVILTLCLKSINMCLLIINKVFQIFFIDAVLFLLPRITKQCNQIFILSPMGYF